MWFKQRSTGVKWYNRSNQLSRHLQYFHPSTPEHISFSPICGMPSKIGHIFGHKWSLSKRRKSDMISSIPSGHSGTSWKSAAIEATVNSQSDVVSTVHSSMWSSHWRDQEGNLKIPRTEWKWRYSTPKPMGWYNEALRQKLITLFAYIKKSETSQINNLMMYLLPWEQRTSQTCSAVDRNSQDQGGS